MRTFGLFLAAIAVTLVLAAALAYPVYALLAPHVPGLEFHRLASRLWQVLMLAGVYAALVLFLAGCFNLY